ncbi:MULTISPECIES: hypothetical protein [Amycolatopsis]|uniref:hypothetical protein n=1 Tax=Amycolatopsis TaxID=1813 RepID=UPI0013045C27|nr:MULTISPECIES: hypothetical protein [Amycolatopsis]
MSEPGGRGRFAGQVAEENVVCRSCDRADATVNRGPQHGLVDQDGREHTGW